MGILWHWEFRVRVRGLGFGRRARREKGAGMIWRQGLAAFHYSGFFCDGVRLSQDARTGGLW